MTIRPAVAADAAALASIYAPYVEDTCISFEEVAPSAEEMAARVYSSLVWLVALVEGEVVGYAYASPHRQRAAYRWSVDVSVYLAPSAQGKGLGRALYLALFESLLAKGYHRAYAGITLPNPASEGLHRAVGFTSVGVYHAVGFKGGQWHDVLWLERSLRPPGDLPSSES